MATTEQKHNTCISQNTGRATRNMPQHCLQPVQRKKICLGELAPFSAFCSMYFVKQTGISREGIVQNTNFSHWCLPLCSTHSRKPPPS